MTAAALLARRAAVHSGTPIGRNVVVAMLAVGAYMGALDVSVVNAILPIIADAFGTDLSSIEWVVTSYLLVQSAMLLTFGRLGDIWGHRRLYLIGLGTFVVSSVLCALATSTPLMVGARAIQAAGASMIFATLAPLLIALFPPEQRGRAIGIQATIIYLGLATGAPLGGWLTGLLGWQSVFLVNVPLGLLALVLGWRVPMPVVPSARRDSFDLAGAAIYVLGLGLLLLGLNQGHAWGWSSGPVLGSLLLGAALLAVWVIVELRVPSPMLDLRLFQHASFAAPVVSNVLSYAAAIFTTFLLPFALIQGRGLSPAQVGLILTCQPVVMALTASVSGALSDRVGTRVPSTLGMVILSAGIFLLSRLDAATPIEQIGAILLLTGLGIGLFTSPNSSAVLGAVPPDRRGVASGVLGTARTLGMVAGVGVAGAVYATALGIAGENSPAAVLRAADTGLLVASGIALLSAAAAVVRISRPAAEDLT
jgi:EmrB/QacA subfamily drug resistance transporter